MSFHSYEERCAATNFRVLDMVAEIDPLGLREYQPFEFQREVFDLWTTSAKAVAFIDGETLKDRGENNDFYGFASSYLVDSVDDAKGLFKKFGKAACVEIRVELRCKPSFVFTGGKDGFYDQSVRAASVPYSWYHKGGLREKSAGKSHATNFVLWRNGEWTDQLPIFQQKCVELLRQDTSDDCRTQKYEKWADAKLKWIERIERHPDEEVQP